MCNSAYQRVRQDWRYGSPVLLHRTTASHTHFKLRKKAGYLDLAFQGKTETLQGLTYHSACNTHIYTDKEGPRKSTYLSQKFETLLLTYQYETLKHKIAGALGFEGASSYLRYAF